jgi:hypothetical protein
MTFKSWMKAHVSGILRESLYNRGVGRGTAIPTNSPDNYGQEHERF